MSLADLITDIQSGINQLQGKLDLLRVYEEDERRKAEEEKVSIPEFPNLDILFTRKEAAMFIGKSLRQFDRICERNKILKETVDGEIRIRKSELLRFKGLDIEHVTPADGDRSKPGTLDELRKQILGK